jgi:hypothetical protein
MDQHKFKINITSCISGAVEAGLSHHTIEKTLQQCAQDIRDDRDIETLYEFRCSQSNCDATSSQKVSKIDERCDVCDERLEMIGSTDVDNQRRFKFVCSDHETVRVHSFPIDEVTCSDHGAMTLFKSSPM